MAVVSVKELHQRRSSGWRDGKENHVVVFLVITDDPQDGTRVALTADDGTTRIPRARSLMDGSTTIRVQSIDAKPVQDSDIHFEVTVTYETSDSDDAQDDVHPLDRPPQVSWSNAEATEPYFIDRSDPPKPVVNSAGDAFDQFYERERGETVITMVRNEPYHDATEADAYSHTVNEDDVVIDGTVYPAGTLKLSPITASRVVEVVTLNGEPTEVTYYKRTYVFKHRKDGWKDKPLDVGTNEAFEKTEKVNGVDTIVKKLRPILDAQGLVVKRPWPLDGTGKKKPSATDKPEELEFNPYTEMSWAALYF